MGRGCLGFSNGKACVSSRSTGRTGWLGGNRASPIPSTPSRQPQQHYRVEPGLAKTKDGAVEAIRVLVVAKRSARQGRAKALTQMRHLGYTAPEQLRCQMKGLGIPALIAKDRAHPTRSADPITAATKASLVSLATRITALMSTRSQTFDALIGPLVAAAGPGVLTMFGDRYRCHASGGCWRRSGPPAFGSSLGTPLWCGALVQASWAK